MTEANKGVARSNALMTEKMGVMIQTLQKIPGLKQQ